MALDRDLEIIIENNIHEPAFVLDYDATIYSLNKLSQKFFPAASKEKLFFDLFKPEISDRLRALYEKCKVSRESLNEKFHLFETGCQIDLEFYFSSIEINYDQKILVTVKRNEVHVEPWKITKIEVFTSEVTKLVKDKAIIEIVDKIKSSFPFSFIGKSKIQKDIDELEHYFWIKDLNRKYILTNRSFAKWLGLKIENIEGKNEKDYLPPYLNNLFDTADKYILDTSNIIVFEGVLNFTKDDETTEIVELPIYDAEKNIIAICGITQDSSSRNSNLEEHFLLYENTIQNFAAPLVVADKENKILGHSKNIAELLNLSPDTEIKGKTVDNIFGEGLLKKITKSISDPDYKKKIIFEVKEGKKAGNFEILIHKIYNTRNKISGYYLFFNDDKESETSTSVKVKMYDIIMQTSPEAIFIYDIDNLKFLEVNESALELYGYNREEFLQMDLTDLYAPEDIQTLLDSSNVIASDSKFSGPWRHKRRDSSSILVMLSKTSLQYKGKRAHLNIVRDITEKIESDKQLQLLKASFENTNDIIMFTDVDGFITFANKPAIKALGYSKKDFEKRPFLSILADSDRAKVNTQVFHSDSKEQKNISIELKKADGELLQVDAIASPIKNYAGEIEAFNITIKSSKEVEVIQKVVDGDGDGGGQSGLDTKFLSQLFHELLTPINVIIGFAGELTEGSEASPEELKEAADIIKENQKQLMQTMDTAVEYSNIEQNQITLKAEEVVFVDVINELEEGIKKTAESNEVELTYGKISSSLSFVSDKQRFMTLLIQYLKFAIQTTKENKVYLSATQNDSSNFLISVKDNVSGISDNLLSNLNDIFSKDEGLSHSKFGISRFSLRLTKRLVEILGAKIEIISKGDMIVEFGLLFPMKLDVGIQHVEPAVKEDAPHTMQQDITTEESIIIGQKSPQASQPESVPKYVEAQPESISEVQEAVRPMERGPVNINEMICLYVEDQVDSQILFKVQMKDLKKIDFATSFEKALPLLQNNHYDFIVLDINLQGEYNGLDALRVIQKMPDYRKVPIFAVTAYALPGDQDRFKAAGFTDFVAKPILREKLVEVLNNSF